MISMIFKRFEWFYLWLEALNLIILFKVLHLIEAKDNILAGIV